MFFRKFQPKKPEVVIVPMTEALGRVTFRRIFARKNLPSFDRSSVDGYAVRSKDLLEASPHSPITLHLVQKEPVEEEETKEVWTGNPLPRGADAVVMLEHTKRVDGEIEIAVPLTPGMNVSKEGEDAKKGQVLVRRGVRLRPHHLGLLAALETKELEVTRKPQVAMLATGSELVELYKKPGPSQLVEVNGLILSGMCAELGAEVVSLGIARDDESEIERKILEELKKADMMITTGGTSVGAHDLVPKVLEGIEPGSIVAHGIAMRPGMPTALAIVNGKPVISLSGNPVAAIVGFEVFARPLIQRMLGAEIEERIKVRARLTRNVAGVLGRRVFLRAKIVDKDGMFLAEPVRVKGSGILTTMTEANGYIVVPEDREGIAENETVIAYLFDTLK